MTGRYYFPTHPRVGRPGGPTPGRGDRPYDPRCATPKCMQILSTVYMLRRELARGDVLLCDLAALMATSLAYLSITKNCAFGQEVLRCWTIQDGEDPDQWSRL